MLGCVQLVLGCVEQGCLFAMGCNLEPPPPVQHDENAHRGSDHDDGRGRPPVRDDGCEDGDAHAGKDRMPLSARRRLHVFTLTPLGHKGLTPWIRFGNRLSLQAGGDGRAECVAAVSLVAGHNLTRLSAQPNTLSEELRSDISAFDRSEPPPSVTEQFEVLARGAG